MTQELAAHPSRELRTLCTLWREETRKQTAKAVAINLIDADNFRDLPHRDQRYSFIPITETELLSK